MIQLKEWAKRIKCQACNLPVKFKHLVYPPPSGRTVCAYCHHDRNKYQTKEEKHEEEIVSAYYKSVNRSVKKKKQKFGKAKIKCSKCSIWKKGADMSLPDCKIEQKKNKSEELTLICKTCVEESRREMTRPRNILTRFPPARAPPPPSYGHRPPARAPPPPLGFSSVHRNPPIWE